MGPSELEKPGSGLGLALAANLNVFALSALSIYYVLVTILPIPHQVAMF